MVDKKKGIFARIGAKFKGVVSELKKVVWPSKEKLKSVTAVVFVVIVFFAIYLTFIGTGGRWLLEKIGFYEQVQETTVAEDVAPEATELEAAAAEEEAVVEAVESSDAEATEAETTEAEATEAETESTSEAE